MLDPVSLLSPSNNQNSIGYRDIICRVRKFNIVHSKGNQSYIILLLYTVQVHHAVVSCTTDTHALDLELN